jgi:hypothetical protein
MIPSYDFRMNPLQLRIEQQHLFTFRKWVRAFVLSFLVSSFMNQYVNPSW